MGTTTPRLKLYKPATVGELVDIAKLNDNSDMLDSVPGVTICTSTTRPGAATRFVGMICYETDTTKLIAWDGATWKTVSDIVALNSKLADSGWQTLAAGQYSAGWSGYNNGTWSGLRYRTLNGVCYVTGAVSKATAAAQTEVVLNMPVGYRPTALVYHVVADNGFGSTPGAKSLILYPDGNLLNVNGGNQAFSLSMTYPID